LECGDPAVAGPVRYRFSWFPKSGVARNTVCRRSPNQPHPLRLQVSGEKSYSFVCSQGKVYRVVKFVINFDKVRDKARDKDWFGAPGGGLVT
jgi:hypothetical protein